MIGWRWAALGLLAVAGCMRLGAQSAPARDYRLDYPPPALSGTPLPVSLGIEAFNVAAVYDREAIVYRDNNYATGAYFDARWSATPGNMVPDLLARDLTASGLFRVVQRAPVMVPIEYQLGGEVQEIEERATASGCTAHLRIVPLLARVRPGNRNPVLLQRPYTADEPCPCNHPDRLAAAMSKAFASISAQLERDVYEAIAADTAGSS